jgi:hypothetical protein
MYKELWTYFFFKYKILKYHPAAEYWIELNQINYNYVSSQRTLRQGGKETVYISR